MVVGATGFVGRHALEELGAREDAHVIAACRDRARLPLRFQAEARIGDLRDRAYTDGLFADVDVVCLAAAWSALYGHSTASKSLYRAPLLGAIDAAARARVRRVVLTSALAVKNVPHSRFRSVRESVEQVWPHLGNLLALEARMKALASERTSMIALRFGTFTGARQDVGILPVLVPRLRRRLVPWIDGGAAPLPMIDGADVGRAFAAAAFAPPDAPFQALDATGPEVATFFDVVNYLHATFRIPLPAFSVSYGTAFRFGYLAELFARFSRTRPLLTRSIVFLSEECREDRSSWPRWGFQPRVDWKSSVQHQVQDIDDRKVVPRLANEVTPKLEVG